MSRPPVISIPVEGFSGPVNRMYPSLASRPCNPPSPPLLLRLPAPLPSGCRQVFNKVHCLCYLRNGLAFTSWVGQVVSLCKGSKRVETLYQEQDLDQCHQCFLDTNLGFCTQQWLTQEQGYLFKCTTFSYQVRLIPLMFQLIKIHKSQACYGSFTQSSESQSKQNCVMGSHQSGPPTRF